MNTQICPICGTPVDIEYSCCLYCGHDIPHTLSDKDEEINQMKPVINPHHKDILLNSVHSIELKTYQFDGNTCTPVYQLLGTGHELYQNYVYIDHFVGMKPGETETIVVRVNGKREIEIPILVPMTLKPVHIGVQIAKNFRLQATMGNQYKNEQSSFIDLYDKGKP